MATNTANDDPLTKEKSYVFEERLASAAELRQLGNECFKRGCMEDAVKAYERALYHIDFDDMQVQFDFSDKHRGELFAAKLPVLLNLCQCLLRSSAPGGSRATQAVVRASEAIEMDPQSAKARFWRGKARMDTGDLDGGAEDLEEAATLAPSDKAIRLALKSLRMKQKEHAQATRKLWGGIFKSRQKVTAGSKPGRLRTVNDAASGGDQEISDPREGKGGKADRSAMKVSDSRWWLLAAIVGLVAAGVAGVLLGRQRNIS